MREPSLKRERLGKQGVISESTIRDKLAVQLHVIEEGLTLIDREYHLKGLDTPSGFVDILARDSMGMLVLIELKRSNAAARQAFHELLKYMDLLRSRFHIRPRELRCVIVSTTWRELKGPFSELCHQADIQIRGYQLNVDMEGNPLGASEVKPDPREEQARLYPRYWVACTITDDDRKAIQTELRRWLSIHGVTDYIEVLQQYGGTSSGVPFPYGYIVACGYMRSEIRQRICAEIESDDDVDEDYEWDPEERIISRCFECLEQLTGLRRDLDVIGPEQFAAEILKGWVVEDLVPHGYLTGPVFRRTDCCEK